MIIILNEIEALGRKINEAIKIIKINNLEKLNITV